MKSPEAFLCRRKPDLVLPLMRWTVVCYLGVYGLLVGAQLLR